MIRLKEAFIRAKKMGLVKRKQELAMEIWGDSSPKSAYMNYSNLEAGKSKKIDIDVVEFLCNKLQVSSEYLFGLSDEPDRNAYRNSVIEKRDKIISIAEQL